ncbi:MAG: transposase, partial [Syntrophorhabdaceae bacterium]
MPRQPRLDATGILHHVMIRGIDRRNIFRNSKDRKDFLERLSFLLPETQTVCYAWAFMSNHAHFLLRSGPLGIANLMRRLLTGYVVSFNKRHKRTGHLFQNRYKSIVCDEEVYFKELVRYIHLNPIRAGIVSTIDDLDVFAYSGHAALIGKTDIPWQDVRYVLEMFSSNTTKARKAYRTYIESALNQGRRDDLSAGTLVKTLQGWTDIKDTEHRAKGDQRILGGDDFVMKILKQAENAYDRKFIIKNKGYTLDTIAD